MERIEKQERQLHMDLLRIFACFSVLMLHSSSQFWYTLPVGSPRWIVCDVYDAVFRFGVPIFVMLSGRFFLARTEEIRLKTLYKKHILRLLLAFAIWSVVYGLWDCRLWFLAEGVVWKDYVTEMLLGRYHLWYLPMMIGLYMLIPVLKSWVTHCSKENLQYFLMLFLGLQIGVSTLKIWYIPPVVLQVLNQFDVPLVCSYAGYFVLGYYLYRYPFSKKGQHRLYAAGIVGAICAALVSVWDSIAKGAPTATAFDSYSLFTFLVTAALYVFFEEVVGKHRFEKSAGWIREISSATFGIYLMHILLIEFLETQGITTMSIDNILGIPLLAVACFVICGVAAALLRRIPFVGKYIC